MSLIQIPKVKFSRLYMLSNHILAFVHVLVQIKYLTYPLKVIDCNCLISPWREVTRSRRSGQIIT